MIEEFKCVVCGSTACSILIEELDDYLCCEHTEDIFDWNKNNQGVPAIDYLREKL